MKHTNRILRALAAGFCALVLALTTVAPAFAVGSHTLTITADTSGHTYEAYQVFRGDYYKKDDSSDPTLSNVEWGSGVNDANLLVALKDTSWSLHTLFTDCTTAADVAEVLTSEPFANNSANLDAVATVIGAHLTTTHFSSTSGTGTQAPFTYTISGLDDGYYFVRDSTDVVIGNDDAYSKFMLLLLGDVSVEAKSDVPTLEKEVEDVNDSTGEASWGPSADHDINDHVNFRLTATVATDLTSYDTYQFIMHDRLGDGLTFDGADSVAVTVDGAPLDANQYTVVSNPEDNCTFHIVFKDLRKIENVVGGSKIVATYSATLIESAVIGGSGNPNTAHLEYSNNPNGSGTGTTTPDNAVVFTYKTIINKVDGNNQPLAGAAFTLEKLYKGEPDEWRPVKTFTADGSTTFEFTGLDDGHYRLSENTTPGGYNTITPIEFDITATHDGGLQITNLKGASTNGGTIEFTPNLDDGSLSATVVNQAGTTLPSTGGMGTTVLYIVGGTLVVVAGVALVVKRRMAQKQ